MASINLFVKGQSLRLTNSCYTIASDTINYITAEVKFLTDDWSDLVKWLHFKKGNKAYDVLLDANGFVDQKAGVNLEEGMWELYIHGNLIQDGQILRRITTNIAQIIVQKTGVLDGEPLPEISPSVSEQILGVAEEAKKIAQSIRDDADSGKFKGDTGPVGPKGIQGDQGPKGDKGEPGRDGGSQIDDTIESNSTIWSSSKTSAAITNSKMDILNKICLPFEQSGAVVECYPMGGFSLNITTYIKAVQEGEGDPSLDNVRPIRGWSSLTLTRNDDTYTQALPETVYGGSYNWATGELTIESILVTFDGTEQWRYNPAYRGFYTSGGKPYIADKVVPVLNRYTGRIGLSNLPNGYAAISVGSPDWIICVRDDTYEGDIHRFKTALAQWAEAQMPLQLVRVLKEPIVVRLDSHPIPALPGVNTLQSDCGDTTVSGREDPIHLALSILDRLEVLEAIKS